MNLEDLYLKSPVWLQKVFINLKGYLIQRKRFNEGFFRCLEEYEQNILNDESVLQTKQTESLSKFLQKAEQSEFWHERFEKYKVDPEAENIYSEILKLPILTKREVKAEVERIAVREVEGPISYTHTSGTTGSGLVFPQTDIMENKQWAVWWRYRKLHGIDYGTWCGWFGGRSIASIKQHKPPFWRVNHPMRQVMFSAHHLIKETAAIYFEEIKNRKLSWLHGYPSQLTLFATYIKELNLGKLPDLKIITLGAENFLESQKKIMEEVFGVPVRQHYGLAEGVANISEWPDGQLRVDSDFCFVEFLPMDSKDTSICKIIGTNFSNEAFPLLRYDTGDIAQIEWQKDGVPRILSIDGRNEDFVTLPNGLKLGRLDHIFKDLIHINEAQIYQPSVGKVIVRIVKGKDFNQNEEKKLLAEARKRLGNEIEIELEYLPGIPRTKSGKLRFVLSDVK